MSENEARRLLERAVCDALNEAEHGPDWKRRLRRDLEESEVEEMERESREARRNAASWAVRDDEELA